MYLSTLPISISKSCMSSGCVASFPGSCVGWEWGYWVWWGTQVNGSSNLQYQSFREHKYLCVQVFQTKYQHYSSTQLVITIWRVNLCVCGFLHSTAPDTQPHRTAPVAVWYWCGQCMSAGKGHTCQLHTEEAGPRTQSTWRGRSQRTGGESSTQHHNRRTTPTTTVQEHHQQQCGRVWKI